MLTKIGTKLVNESLLGGIIGGTRAGNLTRQEREALEKEYDLPEDSNLGWRNAGRGFVGSLLGGGVGAGVSKLITGKPGGTLPLVGAIAGGKFMSDKYSGSRARRIMELNKKPDVSLDLIAQKIRDSGLDGDAARGLLAYYIKNEHARKEAF